MISVNSDKDKLAFIEAEFTLSLLFLNTLSLPSACHHLRIDVSTFQICESWRINVFPEICLRLAEDVEISLCGVLTPFQTTFMEGERL